MKTTLTRVSSLRHEFVEFIPTEVRNETLYVSFVHAVTVHKCCCGCGNEVIAPLSPTDWELTFDGDTVSLFPSIGNWEFRCQSHYWIRKSAVYWDRSWSSKEIAAGRARDAFAKDRHYSAAPSPIGVDRQTATDRHAELWRRIRNLWHWVGRG